MNFGCGEAQVERELNFLEYYVMLRVIISALLLVPCVAVALPPTTASQILAGSKAASGGDAWDSIHTLRIGAIKEMRGKSGTTDTLVDLRTGRMVTHSELGAMTIASGFDGKSGWQAMFNRAAVPNESPAARRAAVTGAYIATYGWLYPKRRSAKIELIGKRADGAESYWVVNVTPEGGAPIDLWVNAKTQFVARVVLVAGSITITTYLRGYRAVHGVKIAFHRRSVSAIAGHKMTTVTQLKTVAVNVPVSAKDFAMPQHK